MFSGGKDGRYANMQACLDAYEGKDVHMYGDNKRLCVAYTVCAIGRRPGIRNTARFP
jgi:hypothetical protein